MESQKYCFTQIPPIVVVTFTFLNGDVKISAEGRASLSNPLRNQKKIFDIINSDSLIIERKEGSVLYEWCKRNCMNHQRKGDRNVSFIFV